MTIKNGRSRAVRYNRVLLYYVTSQLISDVINGCTFGSLQVDGLTKVDEEGYTYEHYYGNKGFQQYGNDYK